MHKEAHIPEPLKLSQNDLSKTLQGCGVSENGVEAFNRQFEATFGKDAEVYPENIFDPKRLEITTPDVTICVAANRSDLVETRVIGGIKYILVKAEEGTSVNGISIQINDA